jgi:CBS domain containing-hemolysin-like protein
MNSTIYWFSLALLCVAVQGFFSMLELAAVSFNRVRLEYYVSKKIKRAIWLQYLLKKPSRLFGTVMIGVNVALQVGSQAAREFYRSVGLDPDLAALTQIFLVVICAELAPLFAARRFPEHVTMLGIPIVYATGRIFAPLIWVLSQITNLIFLCMGKRGEAFEMFMTREELQKVLESHDEENELNIVIEGIFSLKNTLASHLMTPLAKIDCIDANSTVAVMRTKISRTEGIFIPLYQKTPANIVAIANVRDLVRLPDSSLIHDYARPPWFITASTTLMPILAQFRRNKQSLAVVLDPNGNAMGILTLDAIMQEIFGEYPLEEFMKTPPSLPFIHRTFPGNTRIEDFNREYKTEIDPHGVETFAQLMVTLLDHPPVEGDAVVIDRFELIVEEASLLGIKAVTVSTLED